MLRVLILAALLGAGLGPLITRAQEATPAGQAMRSPTREAAWQEVLAAFPMEAPRHEGGQVIYAIPADIASLNGFLADDVYSNIVNRRIFETLIDVSPVDGKPVPELADWWEVAPDGVTYTFHLNKDATWHDGVDFTAEDVVFSLDAALDPEIGFTDVASALASYRAIDDDTVEMVSKGKQVGFLWDVGYWHAIMPRHIWEGVPFSDWASDPGSTGEDLSRVVGTGPFMLTEWVPGDHATLTRYDDYYSVVPTIDDFIVSIQPDEATSAEGLKAGEIDAMDFVPVAQVKEIDEAAETEVATYDSTWFRYYLYNLDPAKTTLFQDPAVREALFIALDRQALVDAIYLGYAEVAQGTQAPLAFAYAPDEVDPVYTYDPERAKRLLADAGWTDTNGDGTVDKDGQEFAFDLLYTEGFVEPKQMMPYLQEAWRAIGVAMTPRTLPLPAVLDTVYETHDFAMAMLSESWDPSGNQGFLFRCDAYEGGDNAMKYCNPAYDALDDQQRAEFEPATRRDTQIALSNIVWKDLPVGIIAFRQGRVGYSTRLHNLFPAGWGEALWSLPWVWVEE
jgi:peptide/nickel transport system substrate-binding protein